MKKTSLFILLILLTFSLSQSNIKTHFKSYQAYIGINEIDKIHDYISKKMKLSKQMNEGIKNNLLRLKNSEKRCGGGTDSFSLLMLKLR